MPCLLATPSGKTGWTGLNRFFENHPEFGRVLLQETDVSASNGTVLIAESAVYARVMGFPATVVRKRDAASKTMTEVSWAEDGQRMISLCIEQIDDESVASLLHLAESIVRSRH